MSAVSPIIVCRWIHIFHLPDLDATILKSQQLVLAHLTLVYYFGVFGVLYICFLVLYKNNQKKHTSIKVSVWLVCGWYTQQRLYGSNTLGLRVSALANIHHFLSGSTYTHMLHGAGIFTYICPNIITQFCRQIYQHHGSHMGIVYPSYSISITIVYYSYITGIYYIYSYIWYQHIFVT
jgi:hypothetical protein